jgi:hypothetical protein
MYYSYKIRAPKLLHRKQNGFSISRKLYQDLYKIVIKCMSLLTASITPSIVIHCILLLFWGLQSSLLRISEQRVEHYQITTAPRTIGEIYYFQQLVTDGGSMYNSSNPAIMKSCLLILIELRKNCSYEN